MIRRARILGSALVAGVALLTAGAPAMAAKTTTVTAASGPVTAVLTFSGTTFDAGPVNLVVTRNGVQTRLDGLEADAGDAPVFRPFATPPLRIRDLDADGEPEVLVRLFSGGAHCCERLDVASYDAATASYRLTTHDFGDAGWIARRLDDTGLVRLVSWDARWAYWGGVYASSPQPIRIWGVAAGVFTDVTRQYPATVRKDQKRQWAEWTRARRAGQLYKGALAAYVADGWSLGAPGPALARVKATYHRPDRQRFFTALDNQLRRLGYKKPAPAPSGGATGGYSSAGLTRPPEAPCTSR